MDKATASKRWYAFQRAKKRADDYSERHVRPRDANHTPTPDVLAQYARLRKVANDLEFDLLKDGINIYTGELYT